MKQMPLAYLVAVSVKSSTDNLGLYLHIPFCEKKCNYCDFYSSFVTDELLDKFTESLIRCIKEWGDKFKNRPVDTVYFGGGTPSLLNHRLNGVLNAVRESFNVTSAAEITLEVNPAGNILPILQNAKKAGINRLSVGMQSGIDRELETLGRKHTTTDISNTVKSARELGFDNISLDIMLGLPFSNLETLKKSLDFALYLLPEHISAYILKIEENTAFHRQKDKLSLPDDDAQAEQYLFMCEFLENLGYNHYEISNFCKNGKHSRHNLKYWRCEEYLGLGPAAHSFVGKKRFYYPKDLKAFMNGNTPLPDGTGGDISEYVMLALRLSDGISQKDLFEVFGTALPYSFINKCKLYEKAELLKIQNDRIHLTNKGMLLSNTIIAELLECFE